MKKFLTLVTLTLGLAVGYWFGEQQSAPEAPVSENASDAQIATDALHALFDEEWERGLIESPVFASYLGDRRWNDQWGDGSMAALDASHEIDRQILVRLAEIDRAALPRDEQINYDLFQQDYEDRIEGFSHGGFLIAFNQRGGIQTLNQVSDSLRFTEASDYSDWNTRLRGVGEVVDQTIALSRIAIAEGYMQPRVIMERLPPQIEAQIVDDAADSSFFDPYERMPEGMEGAEDLRSEALAAIDEVVIPAYRRLLAFFNEEYLPNTFDQVGVWQLPGGRDYYAYRARSFTTTDLTPEEIHQIGLDEVARIRGEMMEVIEEVGFEGSFDDFLQFLRTDPQFYYETPEELLQAYRAMTRRMDPELVHLFGYLPRIPYGVEPIPDAIAPDTTTAYYSRPAADGSRPGTYFVNLYQPETRPTFEIPVLSVHEAVPGHHLQIAIAQELGDLPNFRRFGGFTAFVEGWGLYSERLGYAMGLYDDPYDRFGALTYDMWRAVRLVVDTGMHHMEWSRQEAIDFFMANAAKSEEDIINEIDRYIAWPAQALAYKIGQLRILELRARAETALGDDFDIRGFHDTVLGSGAVPLDVLEANIDAWIAANTDGN
jgi:uncharacterized protein (DUF885 family)